MILAILMIIICFAIILAAIIIIYQLERMRNEMEVLSAAVDNLTEVDGMVADELTALEGGMTKWRERKNETENQEQN